MTVYVLNEGVDFEGERTLSVHATAPIAWAEVERIVRDRMGHDSVRDLPDDVQRGRSGEVEFGATTFHVRDFYVWPGTPEQST